MGVFYPASNSIKVFPTTKRGDKQKDARLITEQGLVNIVNRLLDVESFVITRKFNYSAQASVGHVVTSASPIEFNIHGYYFKLNDPASMINDLISSISYDYEAHSISSGTSIYANIHVFTTGDYTELYGSDNEGVYDGLVLTLNRPLISTDKYLKILEYNGKDWIIPANSLLKYRYDRLGDIDCGEI